MIRKTFITLALFLPITTVAETHTVEVYDFFYDPADITITQGDTVNFVWVNAFHDVIAGDPPQKDPLPYQEAFSTPIDSGVPFERSIVFSRQLLVNHPAPDDIYEYYCSPHPLLMEGSVTVTRTSQDFSVRAVEWQTAPPTSSTSTASCTGTLNGNETEFEISCTHDVENVTAIHLHDGFLGETGPVACTLPTTSPLTATCMLASQTNANHLFDGRYYLNIHSQDYPDGEIRGQLVRAANNRTISGSVLFENGLGLKDVVISDGTRSTTTDVDGDYTLGGVPSGVYQLTASRPGFSIMADTGLSPVLVNANNPTNIDFSVQVGTTCDTDADGDGVCDQLEAVDGSNPTDPGSYRDRLSSPVYLLWNGFLEMLNIIAITNSGNDTIPVHFSLYDVSGVKVYEQNVSVLANGQTDLILNDMPGFSQDSFGIVTLEFIDEASEAIDGQMFYYRNDSTGFEFAFGVPFVAPTLGRSAVGFNTFQPSLDPLEAENEVAQWLSIVNLDSQSAQSFTITKYNQLGELLSSAELSVPAFGRVDLDGGHVDPGPSAVGLNVITPADSDAPYLAQLYRYGGNTPPGLLPSSYSFAFPLLARAGNGEVQHVPISTGGGADNWVEVVNTTSETVSVSAEFYGSNSTLLASEVVGLAPYAQYHFNAGAYLGTNATGIMKLTPSTVNSIVGQSMFYFRNALTGGIDAMYGTPLRESFATELTSSYNLYLEMSNWLKLTNVSSSSAVATLSVFSPAGEANTRLIELSPYVTIELGIHESQYGALPNTFGLITLESSTEGALFSELLRTRTMSDGIIDFGTPIRVR